jgi:hypothetical protein
MFDGMELKQLMVDLKSVKMGPSDRARACALQSLVRWTAADVGEAWALVRRFRAQLKELHESRERARRSVGRKRLGLSREGAARAVEERDREQRIKRDDIGI